jgi:protein-S-isoprenylcysteine O-methyltransferase Ste14
MSETPLPAKPTLVFAIGRFKLTGWRATLAVIALATGVGWIAGKLFPSATTRPGGWMAAPRTNWPLYASLSLWLVFNVYWTVAARHSSAAKQSESSKSRGFHVLILNGSLILLFVPVPGLRGRFLPDAPILAPIGLTIQAAFLLLGVWARRHLGRHWSGEVTVKVDHQLVRSGPYRFIRHPIYTAMIGMYTGTAIVLGQMHSLIAIAIVIAAYWRKIGLEEDALHGVFGTDYDDYRRHSWAVIPPVW